MKHSYQVVCTEHFTKAKVGKVVYGPASYEMARAFCDGFKWCPDPDGFVADHVRLQVVEKTQQKKDK